MSKALSEKELAAIRRQNLVNDDMLDAYDQGTWADCPLSPFTIACMGVDYVNALLGEVERLRQQLAEVMPALPKGYRVGDALLEDMYKLRGRQEKASEEGER